MSDEQQTPVAWLRAQVEAARAVAVAAGGGAWRLRGHPAEHVMISDEAGKEVVYDEGVPDEDQAAHMVLNDPRAIIADCDAKLAILDEHRLVIADDYHEPHSRDPAEYRIVHDRPTPGQISSAGYPLCYRLDCRSCRARFPCKTIRLQLAAYRHREGWHPEWAAT